VALLNVQQTRALVDARSADRWPTVNAGLGLTRGAVANGAVTTSISAGVLVTSYEIDLFDRLRSQSDVAFAQYLASTEASKAVQISLIGAVANSYFALQADSALLNLAQQTLATREDSTRLIQLRFDKGASSQLDLSQAKSLLESARVSVAQSTRQRLLDVNALNLLLGQTAPLELTAADTQVPVQLQELPVGLSSDVLLRRPDVLQAEQQLLAANANIGAARAAFFPKILLTANAGSVSSELANLFSDGTFGWSIAPQLLLPIFDAGRNQANLAVAKVSRDVAVAQYEKAIQSAFREVADALAGRATLGEQMQAQQAQTAAETERARLTELRYKNGASSYLEVLDAQRSLFASQQAALQLQAQSQQNLATLYRVLGGGWLAESAKP
jgi:multidrug efflux system outer membrane protein